MTAAIPLLSAAAAISFRPRKILVLGGTYFLGPAIVDAALAAGHEVTLFNRGKTNPKLYPKLELIKGDRELPGENLSGLEGDRRWDAVIDVWPADPRMSLASAALLKGRVARYLYISSIAAYDKFPLAGMNEQAPLCYDNTSVARTYDFAKAETERQLAELLGPGLTTIRPGIILGTRQDSRVFSYWLSRVREGGGVLAPGDGSDPIQFIDAKDIGRFAIRTLDVDLDGPFNVVGPRDRLTFRSFLSQINALYGNKAKFTWIADPFLEQQHVNLNDLPLYRPLRRSSRPGFMQVSAAKGIAAGLTFRPLAATAYDELDWFDRTRPAGFEFGGGGDMTVPYWSRAGMSHASEAKLLKEWKLHALRSVRLRHA